MKKVLFTATVDSHILHFHIPYLKLFKDNGYEVHVATNGNEEIPYCDVKHVVSFERSPFKINNLKAIKQLKKIIDEEKFDIIHCHTPMGSVVTRIAAMKARKNGTRVIYTAHGFHFFKGAPILNWIIFYPVEKLLSYKTDCLITINEEDYNLAKKKFKTKYIELVNGVGVDESKFNFEMSEKEKIELRKSLGFKKDDFVIIQVGELNKNKNQIMTIKAIQKLKEENQEIKLLLVGKGKLKEWYAKKIKEYHLENNVFLLGYRNDIYKLLKISNCLISTSKREGLPVNLIEAMISNIPIIATNCRGNKDLIENGVNGYLISENANLEEIKQKIKIIKMNGLKVKNDTKKYEKKFIMGKMKDIYKKNMKKTVFFIRSTSTINDSRATKEIKFYEENQYNVVVLGWNRQGVKLENTKNVIYNMYNEKSEYGKGLKNLTKMISFQRWIYKNIRNSRDKIDIIHACDFDTAYISYKAYNKKRTKFVYDIYDYYVESHNLGRIENIIEKEDTKIISNADLVIICTEKRKNQIRKAKPKKVIVIHNSPEIQAEENNNELNLQKIKLCYVGILQNDRLLKEIAEKIKNKAKYELHIGGFGKYENFFKELSLKSDNIKFYGQMKYEDVIKLEKKCDILFATYNPAIANHKYSAPNKIYEAMALGKPIIVCKDTGIDQLVTEEKIGYVIDYDANKFVEILEKIDLETYNEMSIRLKKLYSDKYKWENMKRKLIKEYETL